MSKRIALVALLAAAFLAGSCRNPLSIGLGDDIDLETPSLAVKSHANGAYVSGAIELEGTYADDFQDVTVRVSLDNGVTFGRADVDATARHWSYSVDTTTLADGGRDVIITVTDGAGKTIEKRTLLYFDNTPPVVLVKVPLGYKYPPNEYNGTVSLRGDAFDQFPIAHVGVEVYSASGTLLASSAGDIGTNSWQYNFPSVGLVGGIENCDVIVTATDRAGNQNATLYHIADVTTFNSGVALAVEEVAALDASSGAFRAIALTADSARLAADPKLTLRINQGLDLPVFDIYNPDPGGTIGENTLAPSSKAIGMVTDDAEGVNVATVQVRFDGGAWGPVQTTVGTGLAVRWEHSLSGLLPGDHTMQLRASDNLGAQGYSVTVDFRIDANAPTVEITSPSQGAYLNSTSFTITGTASSGEAISEVRLSLDDGATWKPTPASSGDGFANWTYNVVGAPTDAVSIKARVTTITSKIAYYNLSVVVDTQAPTVSFLSPPRSTSVNGPVTVRGASSDNRQITKVELRIGEPASWIVLSDPYSWDYLFDSAGYANATYATEELPAGSNIWKLRVYARITDIAGNVTTTTGDTYYFFVDQALDKPRVAVISPPAGTTNVAGPVIISGTGLDDDGLHHVEMQIDVNGDGDFADQVDFWNGSAKGADGNTNSRFEKETVWYPVTGTSLWSQQINGYGEMYQTEAGHTGDITVRVRAVDTKDGGLTAGISGDIQEFTIHLDDTIPRIESLNRVSGDYVTGEFHITGQALDDEQIGTLQISYDGGINYQNLPGSPFANPYSLDITIDTRPSGLNIASGILYLRLKITDNANYQSITSMNLNVDNVHPTDNPSHYTGAAGDINSGAARVQGTAQDAGTVSGVEEIEVYFVRGTLVYNPKTGATTTIGAFDFGDGNGSVDYPTGAGSENLKITINDFNEFGNDGGGNGDGDGFNESLTLAGSTYNWWAEFNSAVIPDGTIEIHYAIFDNAGNGTHHQTIGFVKNHKPSITSVTVGSDIDESGTVEADERFVYDAACKTRNRLYIEITATDDDAIADYEVIRDPYGTPVEVLSSALGTIDVSGYNEGATSFLCRVTDSDGITAETLLAVTIENDDVVPPSIVLAALAQDQLVAGHLEESGASLHDGGDADVSGTIALTGTASDNQRIEHISVQIDSFDPDGAGALGAGAEHTVAQWSGTTLVSVDAAFAISAQSLSEGTGHQVSWTYTWNSAGVTGVAADNRTVRLRAYDFASAAALDNDTVDVVPYISGITRILSTNRSKYGRFAVQEGEAGIVLSGYNLAQTGTNWVRVYNTRTGGATYDDVAVTASGPPYTSMTVSLATVTHSGWLRLAVSGVEAINNENADLITNKEDDGSGLASTLWNDDRYLRVWAVGGSFQASSGAQYPSMSIMNDGSLHGAWINYATSLMTYGTTSAAPVAQWGTYDPPEFTDMYVDSAEATLKYAIAFVANHYGGSGWGGVPLEVGSAGFVGVRTPNSRQLDGGNTYAYPIESLNLNQQLWQFSRPKVVRSNGGASDNQDRLHVAYYDSNTRAAKYSFMYDDAQANARGWIVLDGGTDGHDVRYVTGTATRPTTTTLTDAALNGNPLIANGQTIMLVDTVRQHDAHDYPVRRGNRNPHPRWPRPMSRASTTR